MTETKHDHLIRGVPDTTWQTLDNMEKAFGVKTKGKLLTKIVDTYNRATMKQWEPPMPEEIKAFKKALEPPSTPLETQKILDIATQLGKKMREKDDKSQ